MVRTKYWASLEDFATLFCYFWCRDFPITLKHIGAQRIDWNIHVGVIVRNIADLMGLFSRFESVGRNDAIIRNANVENLIALEWEWEGVYGNELCKLKKRAKEHAAANKPLSFCVLITYTHTPNIDTVCKYVNDKWSDAACQLLLILIDFEDSKDFFFGRAFHNINLFAFKAEPPMVPRTVPALPWNIEGTRWSILKEN